MRDRKSVIGVFLLLFVWEYSCSPNSDIDQKPINFPAYVLAGNNVSEGFRYNSLNIFDAQNSSGDIIKIDLLQSWAYGFDIAPDGSIWIGYSGSMGSDDNRLQIYFPQTSSMITIDTCLNPSAGVKFAAGRAFIGCANDGFSGVIQVLDWKTQHNIMEIELTKPEDPLLLVNSGANSSFVLFSAMTVGDDASKGFSSVALIDPITLQNQIVDLGQDTDVWTILPYKEKFILLNSQSYYASDSPRPDLLIIDPKNPKKIEFVELAFSSPVWGQIDADVLFAYHNPSWNSLNDELTRVITRTNLLSLESIAYYLPHGFDADSLTIWNNVPCLTYSNYYESKETHGVYCLDNNGKLVQKLSIPYASDFIVP